MAKKKEKHVSEVKVGDKVCTYLYDLAVKNKILVCGKVKEIKVTNYRRKFTITKAKVEEDFDTRVVGYLDVA